VTAPLTFFLSPDNYDPLSSPLFSAFSNMDLPTTPAPCDFALLRALAVQVRAFTVDQIRRGWFVEKENSRAALECCDRLEQCDLLTRRIMEAHPSIELRSPLYAWKPGQRHPTVTDFRAIAQASQARWNKPHTAVEVFVAAPRAARLFGAFVDARRLKHCEASHDLHLSEVFLRYKKSKAGKSWWGEGAFPKLGLDIRFSKDPDAFLLNANSQATRIIEFAGSYDEEHLRCFHDHCAGGAATRFRQHFGRNGGNTLSNLYSDNGTAYELW
jgi:hypothetical protein